MSTQEDQERRIDALERRANELELEVDVRQRRLETLRANPIHLLFVLTASMVPSIVGYILAERLEFIPELVNDAAPVFLIGAIVWLLAVAQPLQVARSRYVRRFHYRNAVSQVHLILVVVAVGWLLYDKSRLSLEFAFAAQFGFLATVAFTTIYDMTQPVRRGR